eukprot:487985_1
MLVKVIILNLFVLYATDGQSCYGYPPSKTCSIECNFEVTGGINGNDDVYYIFENISGQEIRISNCGSSGDSQMYLIKISSNGVISDANYQLQANNACDGNDCVDPEYDCSEYGRETFYYSYLDGGTYWIKYTNSGSSSASYSINVICGVLLLPAVTYPDGSFAGAELMVRGFNIFTAEIADTPILNIDYIADMKDIVSSEGASCSYSSLTFDSQYDSWSSYTKSNSGSISASYQTDNSGAGGSASITRTTLKTYAQSGQYYIYSLGLDCRVTTAAFKGLNKLFFTDNFIHSLLLLPQQFNGNLEEYIEFWETYGTHIFKSGTLGGSISGATVVNKCEIENNFQSNTQYKACLNGAYKGVEVEGCNSESRNNYQSSS